MKSPDDASGYADLGAVPVPAKAPDYSDLGATPVPKQQDYSDLGAVTPQQHVQDLISDPKFSPADYAAQTGDVEGGFQARQALQNRTAGQKWGAFGEILTEPETYANAAKGVGKFGIGLVAAPFHTIAQAGATIGAPIAGALGATDLQKTLVNEQQTQGAEATLAAQQIEQGLRNTGQTLSNVAADTINPVGGTPTTEAQQRARFADEIQAAKNSQQLQQGRPLETGAVAAAARAATDQEQLSDIYSPEALAENNARQASPLLTESMAAAADPTNLAIPLAGEIPGVKNLAGGIVQAGGKLLQVPESIMSAVPRLNRLSHGGGVLGAVMHPGPAAGLAGAYGLGKVLGWAGRAFEEQGGALRSGIPSALDQTAQSALSAGESAIGTNAQRVIGNTAGNIVSTALGFAPVNYALSGGDPRQFAQSEVGAGAIGGVFGLGGERARMEDIAKYRLAQYGAQQFTDTPMWQAHQAQMSKFSPEDQQAINALRGTLYGGTGTDVLVLDGQNFAKQVGDIGGNARGQFAQDHNSKTIYVNADAVGNTSAQKAGGALDTAGHETGHAVVDFLKNAGREADAQNLFSSIAGALTPEQTQALTDTYHAKLLASTDLTGKSPEQIEAIRQKVISDNPPEKILEENLAEITRKILNGRPISSFALPTTIAERVSDAASRWMEARGWSPKIDDGASLGFKAQMVKEAARKMQDVLYETGKRASAAAGAGETEGQRLIKARNDLANIPPITSDMPAARAAAIRRQQAAAQKVIDEIQGKTSAPESTGTTPDRVIDDTISTPAAPQPTAAPTPAERPKFEDVALPPILKPKEATPKPAPETPKPDAERPLPTPPPSEPLPPSDGGSKPSDGGNTTTAKPVEAPPKDVAGTPAEETPVVHTKEDLDAIAAKARTDFLADKAFAKAGKNKGSHTAKNQELADKAAFDAAAEAHAETVPANYGGMKQRVDSFGKKSVSGNLDPSRPFDSWLIDQAQKAGNLPEGALDTMLKLQDAVGKTVTFDYGHAPVAEEGEQPTQESRATQQAKHSVKARLAGESPTQTEAKTSIPLGIQFNPGNKSFNVFAASPEKLLNNFNHLAETMQHVGQNVPYKSINDPQFVADFKGVIRNHQNGWFGDGSRPAVGTAEYPNTANPDWVNSPERAQIPEDRFDFINMMLGDEGAKAATPQAKAKAHLANENRTLVNEAGETNETRQALNDAVGSVQDKNGNPSTWSKVTLEDPLNENLSPALASNVRPSEQADESIRQHGKVGDLGRFFEGGKTPNRAKSAAGFMPNDTATDDMRNQAQWMDSEAKTRGYSGLQELLEQDPSAQTKMAAQWRAYHPRDEQGTLLQNEASRVINNTIYGDQNSDTSRPLAGARSALGDAETVVRGSVGAIGANPKAGTREVQNAALKKWAEDNQLLIKDVPALDERQNVGGAEHDVYHDPASGRWIKVTNGTMGAMGMTPAVTRSGGFELRNATPLEYLESRKLQNQVFGDDIRLHAVEDEGDHLNIVTSQPDVRGAKPTQPQIDSAMEDKGFRRMDDSTYYRKSDNAAVFDLHTDNAFIHNGALLPIDAIVVHPSEDLVDALKDSQLSLLNRKPAPNVAGSFMDAARARLAETPEQQASGFLPNDYKSAEEPTSGPSGMPPSQSQSQNLSGAGVGASKEDSGAPEDGQTPSERLTREAEAAGVSMSLETLKALMRGDFKAMARVRQQIREKTGQEPRFLPATPSVGIAPTTRKPFIPPPAMSTQERARRRLAAA